MSKSLGNFFTIREILDKYDAEVIRLFILSSHYRSPIEFSQEQLHDAESSLERYYSTMLRIDDFLSHAPETTIPPLTPPLAKWGVEIEVVLDKFKDSFEEAMDDDFNTALAIGHIFDLVREVNKFLDSKPSGEAAKALIKRAKDILETVGEVLNLFNRTPAQWNIDLLKSKKIPLTGSEIENRIEERRIARQNKDWAKADAIRKELDEKGIILEDKRDGTSWKVKIS
jgi:cysteinyl-tRNA synthetase